MTYRRFTKSGPRGNNLDNILTPLVPWYSEHLGFGEGYGFFPNPTETVTIASGTYDVEILATSGRTSVTNSSPGTDYQEPGPTVVTGGTHLSGVFNTRIVGSHIVRPSLSLTQDTSYFYHIGINAGDSIAAFTANVLAPGFSVIQRVMGTATATATPSCTFAAPVGVGNQVQLVLLWNSASLTAGTTTVTDPTGSVRFGSTGHTNGQSPGLMTWDMSVNMVGETASPTITLSDASQTVALMMIEYGN